MRRGFSFAASNQGAAPPPDPGLIYLIDNAYFFYDFTQETVSPIASISDISNSNRNADSSSPATPPDLIFQTLGINTYRAYQGENKTSKGLLINNMNPVYEQSHEILMVYTHPETFSVGNDFYGIMTVNDGTNLYYISQENLRLSVLLSSPVNKTGYFIFRSAGQLYGQTVLRIRFDFGNEIKFWINGVPVAENFNSGGDRVNWSSFNPTGMSGMSQRCGLACYNNQGAIVDTSAVGFNNCLRASVTPLMTDEQAVLVQEYLMLDE